MQYYNMKKNGFIYYDDSKHPNAEFYLGAFIYSERDLNEEISQYISASGLSPKVDEFKSRLRMDQNPEQKELRKYLKRLIRHTKIAIVITAPNEKDFKYSTSKALIQLIENNQEDLIFPLTVHLDEGIYKGHNDDDYKSLVSSLNLDLVNLHIEQDSKVIRGIQLADLVAHTCSIIMKESLGLINKTIKAGNNSGYDPDTDIEIGFEMWVGIRYNFFSTPPPHPDKWESQLDCIANVEDKGLFISDSCNEKIRVKGKGRFGEMYLGCIH
jgi:hypothetical protein